MNLNSLDLNITLPSSRYLGAWFILGCAGSLAVLYPLSLSMPIKCFLSIAVLLYTLHLYYHYIKHSFPHSCKRIQQLSTNEWLIKTNKGHQSVVLTAHTFVSSWLIILIFHKKDSHSFFYISIPLFVSEIDSETWRKLNIYLRWQASHDLNKELEKWT